MTAQNLQSKSDAAHHDGDSNIEFDARELLQLLGKDLRQMEKHLAAAGAYDQSPITENIAETAKDLGKAIKTFLDKAQSASEIAGKQTRDKSQRLHEEMEKHPVAAAGSALALGYLLGRTVFGHHEHAVHS